MKKFCTLLFLVSLLTSCFHKEDFDFSMMAKEQNFSYDVALPVVDARLYLGNLIGNLNLIKTDEDGFMHLIYKSQTPIRIDIGADFKIQDQLMPSYKMDDIHFFKYDTIIKLRLRDSLDFQFSGNMEMDKVLLESCIFEYGLLSTIGTEQSFKLTLLNILNEKQEALVLRDSLLGASSANKRIDLKNYTIDFSGKNSERLYFEIEVACDLNTANNILPNMQKGSLAFSMGVRNINYQKIDGYLGRIPFVFSDSLLVPAFNNVSLERIRFDAAYLRLNFYNGISAPVRFIGSDAKAFFSTGGSQYLSLFDNNYDLEYPSPDEFPMEKYSRIESNNLSDLLANFPNLFTYEILGALNPENDPTKRNSISKDSRLELDFEFDLPLYCSVEGYVMADTFLFPAMPDVSMINTFRLLVNLENAFPVDLDFRVDLLDKDMKYLFSMVLDKQIPGAKLNGQGRVACSSKQVIPIDLRPEQIQDMSLAKHLSVRACFQTTDRAKVKLYQTDFEGFFGLKIGAQIKFKAGMILDQTKKEGK